MKIYNIIKNKKVEYKYYLNCFGLFSMKKLNVKHKHFFYPFVLNFQISPLNLQYKTSKWWQGPLYGSIMLKRLWYFVQQSCITGSTFLGLATDHLDHADHPDPPDHPNHPDHPDNLIHPIHLDHKDHLAHPAHTDQPNHCKK